MQFSSFAFYLTSLANAFLLTGIVWGVHWAIAHKKQWRALSFHLSQALSYFFFTLAPILWLFEKELDFSVQTITNPLQFVLMIFELPPGFCFLLSLVMIFVVAYPIGRYCWVVVHNQKKERKQNEELLENARKVLCDYELLLNGYTFIMNHNELPDSIKRDYFRITSLRSNELKKSKKCIQSLKSKKLK